VYNVAFGFPSCLRRMMEASLQIRSGALTEDISPGRSGPPAWAADTPALLPITTLLDLFNWYRLNLCGKEVVDPRGCRVSFLDTDFVHLIKLTDKYGKKPKNRRMTVEQIRSGRIILNPKRIQIRRAQELSWARPIIESPTMIVPNWQAMGRAIPGDAYIKNFGTEVQPIYRVLICGHAGKKRWAVTIFPRERFADREVSTVLWP
jgi:hypothetical protein